MCMVNVVCDILTDGGVKTFNFLVVLLRLKTFLFCLFKVNSVQEAYANCFAVHIKFEILQIACEK